MFKKTHFTVLALIALCAALAIPASATPVTFNSCAGCPGWSGDPMVNITNVQAPWAPNGTTGPGARWVNSTNSGFQGGGPALGSVTTYFLSLGPITSFSANMLADDGGSLDYRINGGGWVNLVNSMGNPQGPPCVIGSPSCPVSGLYSSGTVSAAGNVDLRFMFSQNVNATPQGLQTTVIAESVPEPATLGFGALGIAFVIIGKIRRDRTNKAA